MVVSCRHRAEHLSKVRQLSQADYFVKFIRIITKAFFDAKVSH